MSRRRPIAVLAIGLGAAVLGWVGPTAVDAGILPTTTVPTTTPPTDPPTTDPPTTEEPEPTTVPTTPTTVRRTTTTSTTRPTRTTVDQDPPPTFEEPEPTTTTAAPTTTVPRLLVDGPPVDPLSGVEVTTTSTTAPPAVESREGRTARQVTLAVSGLIVLAAVFGGLTVWYWKRTKPRVAPAGTR